MILFRKIEGAVDELLKAANLRDGDMVKLATMTHDKRRREWLISKVMVWQAVGKHVDYMSGGAPSIDNGYISISHCSSHVAVCISDSGCGIDIEHVDRNVGKISYKFAVQREIEIAKGVFAQNPDLLVWCAKEALYKYSGIEGADFTKDFTVVSAKTGVIDATAFGHLVKLKFELHDNILIVYC